MMAPGRRFDMGRRDNGGRAQDAEHGAKAKEHGRAVARDDKRIDRVNKSDKSDVDRLRDLLK
jgi:hypothetical protein